jgi:hypothetical protein
LAALLGNLFLLGFRPWLSTLAFDLGSIAAERHAQLFDLKHGVHSDKAEEKRLGRYQPI